jgi:hypothetical protein
MHRAALSRPQCRTSDRSTGAGPLKNWLAGYRPARSRTRTGARSSRLRGADGCFIHRPRSRLRHDHPWRRRLRACRRCWRRRPRNGCRRLHRLARHIGCCGRRHRRRLWRSWRRRWRCCHHGTRLRRFRSRNGIGWPRWRGRHYDLRRRGSNNRSNRHSWGFRGWNRSRLA